MTFTRCLPPPPLLTVVFFGYKSRFSIFFLLFTYYYYRRVKASPVDPVGNDVTLSWTQPPTDRLTTNVTARHR